jgi:hypothetical protein
MFCMMIICLVRLLNFLYCIFAVPTQTNDAMLKLELTYCAMLNQAVSQHHHSDLKLMFVEID